MILKAHEAEYIKPRCEQTRMIRKPSAATYLIGKRKEDIGKREEGTVVVSTVRDTDETGRFLIGVDRQSEMSGQQTLYDHAWMI